MYAFTCSDIGYCLFRLLKSSAVCVVVFLACGTSTAESRAELALLNQQLQVAGPENWQFEITPYVWFAGFSGDLTVKNREAEIDLEFDEILDVLDMAGTGHFEAKKGPVSLMVNLDYYEFGADAELPLNVDVEAGLDLLILEGGIGYEFYSTTFGERERSFSFEGLAGARYFDIDSEIDFEGPVGLNPTISRDKSWTDGFVGFRMKIGWFEKLRSSFRFDIGAGGSDLTYQLALLQNYKLSESATLVWGYRHLAIDFDEGSGTDRFEADVAFTGPLVGLNFKF